MRTVRRLAAELPKNLRSPWLLRSWRRALARCRWSVSIGDPVLVIGKLDGEFTGIEVLGIVQSIPRREAVFAAK